MRDNWRDSGAGRVNNPLVLVAAVQTASWQVALPPAIERLYNLRTGAFLLKEMA